MSTYLQLIVKLDDVDARTVSALAPAYQTLPRTALTQAAAYLSSVAAGDPHGGGLLLLLTDTGWAKATGYYAATNPPANNDTTTVAGVVFTWKTTPDPTVQTQIALGATGNAAMTNLANAINGNYYLSQLVVAANTGDAGGGSYHCLITALVAGPWANTVVTTTEVSANITVSGAALTGGTMGIPAAPTAGARYFAIGLTP